MRELRPQALLDDLQKVVADTEHLLRATAGDTTEKVAQARAKAEKSLRASQKQLHDLERSAVARARRTARTADRYAHDNPWQAIGFVAGLAFVAGFLISRR